MTPHRSIKGWSSKIHCIGLRSWEVRSKNVTKFNENHATHFVHGGSGLKIFTHKTNTWYFSGDLFLILDRFDSGKEVGEC